VKLFEKYFGLLCGDHCGVGESFSGRIKIFKVPMSRRLLENKIYTMLTQCTE
jgi:hypothetical protein